MSISIPKGAAVQLDRAGQNLPRNDPLWLADVAAQMPNTSLSNRADELIERSLARSSSLFFGTEKPWPAPL